MLIPRAPNEWEPERQILEFSENFSVNYGVL